MKLKSIIFLICAAPLFFTACEGGDVDDNGNNAPAAFSVTYDGNGNTGGNVPTDSTEYEQGQNVTVPGNTGGLIKSGYSFAGWCVSKEGTGDSYTEGQTFTIGSADVTLFAKWTANPTYTVVYRGNGKTGGDVPTDSTNYEQGQIINVKDNTGNLVRSGYSFSGWCLNNAGTGTTYIGGQTFAMGNANVILYAKWTAVPTYTVTYSGNGSTGGSVPADGTHYEQGNAVTVRGNTGNLVRTNYIWAGWCVNADGTGTTYTGNQTFAMGSANVTLYAKWTATYTVTYNGNGSTGGSVPADSKRYQQGNTVTVLARPPDLVSKASWDTNNTKMLIFLGWNTSADGSGTNYNSGNTFTMGGANVTLYANWTAISVVGPAGGYIFYEKGDSEGRYYEVAPQSVETTAIWGSTSINIGGTGTAVGTGETNTGAMWIISQQEGYNASTAATYCSNLTFGGCDDWFLPSFQEAISMFNLYRQGLGGFSGSQAYWTSSQYSTGDAYQVTRDGNWGGMLKSENRLVRPVRRFN